MDKSSNNRENDVFFNIRLRPEMHRRLAEIAERNERTIAAEIRMAVREHLEREELEVA